ncbi:phosphoglycerate dehydrogenase [Candidatus Woesearchaeota archaeon]|nr:phosphoglycerate dehydrogenase [Candidatus Woesearchaeota archaeon]
MSKNKYFIIDFDSTLTQVEALDELAALSLKNNPKKHEILEKIKGITVQGMEGKVPIPESLSRRLNFLKINRKHIDKIVGILKKKISPSFKRNKSFFKRYQNNVYIISNGFKEYIVPVVKPLNILEKNIYANTLIFNSDGDVAGYDKSNILAQEDGKAKQLKALNLKGDVYVIGDGYTDYEMKASGLVTKFFAFTENVEREVVVKKADHVIPTFDEFLYINKLPMSISYPKNRINVLLLENIHKSAASIFKNEGYTVEIVPKSLDEEELIKKIKNVSILGIRSKTEITENVLKNADRLMAIGAFCIGTNQVDLNCCSKKGIAVFNAPYSNTRSVVELVIGEIVMLMRDIFEKSAKLHKGVWDKSAEGSYELRGKKLGIVGYGNIGSQLSILAESLGMDIYYYDIVEKLALGNAKQCRSLKELLKNADIVSIHVDGNPANKNLIGEKEFGMMKNNVIFLNLSRGFVVDTKALVKYLKNGKIKGVAIDVFPNEPKSSAEEFVSELRELPNVILTPHIGGSTVEAQENIAEFVTGKIVGYVNNGNTFSSANLPNIQLPQLQEAHRLLHIHENVPGILAQINSILAKNGINIEGQYLKTNEQVGYAITDVNKKYDNRVIEDLKKIPHTIKFRVLY